MKWINNKKGDKIISIYWFAILAIVAVGIAAVVIIFYGNPYDIREAENELLMNNIANCMISEGKLISMENLGQCHLNLEDIEYNEAQYYIRASFFDLNNIQSREPIEEGNKNFLGSCEIQNEDYNKIVKCNEKSVYAFDEENNQVIIKILTAVRKTEKNVK